MQVTVCLRKRVSPHVNDLHIPKFLSVVRSLAWCSRTAAFILQQDSSTAHERQRPPAFLEELSIEVEV